MSVLEAAALDVPILARAIPSLVTLPLQGTVDTPAAAAETITALAQGKGDWATLQTNATVLREHYSPARQAEALAELYST